MAWLTLSRPAPRAAAARVPSQGEERHKRPSCHMLGVLRPNCAALMTQGKSLNIPVGLRPVS